MSGFDFTAMPMDSKLQNAFQFLSEIDRAKTVSYTHLDVYKRQGEEFIRRAELQHILGEGVGGPFQSFRPNITYSGEASAIDDAFVQIHRVAGPHIADSDDSIANFIHIDLHSTALRHYLECILRVTPSSFAEYP